MIATHNRAAELVKTVICCLSQAGSPNELLIMDDCSTDGTLGMVRERFPGVSIVRNERNRGSIACRNDILSRAKGDYMIALDDDSRFVDADACERIVRRMDAEPDLGVIAFQVIGPENPGSMTPQGRLTGEWHCSSFACCGAVIRRSMLEKTGLFPEYFFHAYEEPDLAMRAWDAGYRVLQWNEIVVYHEFTGLNRNEQRTHRRHARNEACSVVMRYPWWLVVPCVFGKLLAQARYAFKRGWLLREPRVWLEFLWRLPKAIQGRKPVRWSTIKLIWGLNRRRAASVSRAVDGRSWRIGSGASRLADSSQ
jgi:GT2 family glycosyltransferase